MYNRLWLMNEALDKVDSRYRLAVIVYKRARLIGTGDTPLVKTRHIKPVTVALEEFAKGYLEWRPPEQEEWEE